MSDTYIYKYIRLEYLLEWLRTKKMRLDPVYSWQDPYENFFLKQSFGFEGKEVSMTSIAKDIYGQSWTTKRESDAMWRIYSHDVSAILGNDNIALMKRSIRIRTTPQKLLRVVQEDLIPCQQIIRKVSYRTKEEMIAWLKQIETIKEEELRMYFIDSCFIKRDLFSYEDESRLIVEEPGSDVAESKKGAAFYSFNPDEMIEEYTIDPRLDKVCAYATQKILENNGIPASKLNQSMIYSLDLSNKIRITRKENDLQA